MIIYTRRRRRRRNRRTNTRRVSGPTTPSQRQTLILLGCLPERVPERAQEAQATIRAIAASKPLSVGRHTTAHPGESDQAPGPDLPNP